MNKQDITPLYVVMTCQVCGRNIASHGQRNHAEYHVRRGEARQSNEEDQRRYLNWGIPWPAEYEKVGHTPPDDAIAHFNALPDE